MDAFEKRTGILQDDMALLAKIPLYSNFPAETLRYLLEDATVRSYPRNSVLFVQDEPATHYYVVFDGWVKLFRQAMDGHESIIAVLTKGEPFAHAAVFDAGKFPVTATIVEEARLLAVPARSFMNKLSENSEVCIKIISAMSRQLRYLVQQIEQRTVKSSAERLAEFLVGSSMEESGPSTVYLPLDKLLIAGRLGMQPETLSRALAKLRKLGVECKGHVVTILEIDDLRDFHEGKLKSRGGR